MVPKLRKVSHGSRHRLSVENNRPDGKLFFSDIKLLAATGMNAHLQREKIKN